MKYPVDKLAIGEELLVFFPSYEDSIDPIARYKLQAAIAQACWRQRPNKYATRLLTRSVKVIRLT